MNEKEVFEICNQIDSFIAEYLAESIVIGTSYDMLEAHHGILPISRNCFYRRRRIVQRIMKQRMGRVEVIYALSDFLIMILSWLVKQSLRAFLFQEVQP